MRGSRIKRRHKPVVPDLGVPHTKSVLRCPGFPREAKRNPQILFETAAIEVKGFVNLVELEEFAAFHHTSAVAVRADEVGHV
jgi:hypothetical protein